jgi:transposase
MAGPLGIDLRERVVAAVDDKKPISEVALTFNVSRKAIYNWLNLRKQTSSLAPKSGYQKGHSQKVKNWEEFKEFAQNNRHHTLEEMCVEWKKEKNDNISISAMERSLKKIGYTSKKNFWVCASR